MSLYHNRQGLDCLIRALQNYLDEARAEAERRPLQPFPALKEAESDLEHLQQLLRELPRPCIFCVHSVFTARPLSVTLISTCLSQRVRSPLL
jgi:hypothetical protein